ncbi:MAG: acetyl-CoA carboxylase biotin carboxyl carrier protein [bacterium]|nr:acetyl-CoA carboxylase biotin carboxyl carrier protein [bacterium]
MNEETIRKLVKLVESSDIESLTVRNSLWFSNVTIVKRSPEVSNGSNGGSHGHISIAKSHVVPTMPTIEVAAPAPAPQPMQAMPQPQPVAPPAVAKGKEIKSPMVGTFYISPEPGAPPFAEIGTRITKGQTICIIEAMKLMNEIEAEFDGVVVKRMVENAQPVEFGQSLFIVEPT